MRLLCLCISLLLASCGKQDGDTPNQPQYMGQLLTLADLKLPPPDDDFPYGKEVVNGHIFQSIRERQPEGLRANYMYELKQDYIAHFKKEKITFTEWFVGRGASDTAYYDTCGHLFAKRNNGTLMPTSNMYRYDSLGFLTYSAFFSCTHGVQIHSYHFDPIKRTLCVDIMDSRIPAIFGKFYNQVAASYKHRGYTVFFFDTAGYATQRTDILNSAEEGYIKLTRYTYTATGNPHTVQQVTVRTPASADYYDKSSCFLKEQISRSVVKYYYHDNLLDSCVMNGELTCGSDSRLIQTTYFSEGLPRRMVEKWLSDYSNETRVFIWKYIKYDSINRKRFELLMNNRKELLPKGMIRIGY